MDRRYNLVATRMQERQFLGMCKWCTDESWLSALSASKTTAEVNFWHYLLVYKGAASDSAITKFVIDVQPPTQVHLYL